MVYEELIAVGLGIHTKHTNAICGQNVEFGWFDSIEFFNLKTRWYIKFLLGFEVLRIFN
jgi:hypothetical protein